MRRLFSKSDLGGNKYLYRVHLEDEPSAPGYQANARLPQLLIAMAETPDLIACGYTRPEKISIFHNGNNWVVKCEGEGTES